MRILNRVCAVLCLSGAGFAQDAARVSGWVVLPINEYGALRSKAYPVEREPDSRPVEAVLSRIDYDLHLDGSLAAGHVSLTVDILSDGWVKVPIPSGLLVSGARVGGKPVALAPVTGRNGELAAVLSGKGRSVLVLNVAFNLVAQGGPERLTLPAGGSGVTRAEVTGVPQDVEVTITGGFIAENAATRWVAYGRGSEPLTLMWRKKIEERRVELPLRMRGSLTQLFGLGEDSTALNAEVEIEVLQGSARQAKIAVPDNLTINQVQGATIADWEVQSGALTVSFLEPVERSVKFTISGETRLPRDGAIDIPLLRLLEVEREGGGAAVEVLGAAEIQEASTQGLDNAEPVELGHMVAARQSPSLRAFRIRAGSQTRSLHVQLARYAQEAVLTANVEEARYRTLITIEGRTLVQARYAIRNNQRSFVRITLPPGAAIWSASLAGRSVRPGKAPDGSLVFPLAKGGSAAGSDDAPAFAIEILYLAQSPGWTAKGRVTLALPALDLPVSRTGLMLYYPPAFHVTAEAGAFRTQAYEKPASAVLNAQMPASAAIESAPPASRNAADAATQALVDRYRARTESRRAAVAMPIQVSFPAVGPSLYLVSELTGESKAPTVEVSYQKEKEKRGGVR